MILPLSDERPRVDVERPNADPGGHAGGWRWALSIPLAAALLYYSLRGVEWSGIWRIIAAARWGFIVAGAAISGFNFFVRSLRWRILLNAEARLSVGLVF